MAKDEIKIYFLNSLNKTINDQIDLKDQISEIKMLQNETYSFFIALKSDKNWGYSTINIQGIDKKNITLSVVKYVYAKYIDVYHPEGKKSDDFFIHKDKGMFPDILLPLTSNRININNISLTILLVQIRFDKKERKPNKCLNISFESEWKDEIGSKKINLNIINEKLPPNNLLVTHWFHYDCLAEYYNLELFSKTYYEVLDNYLTNYVNHGNTMLLIPLFTPCIDTEFNHERLTCQLVDVVEKNGKYIFNFDKLKYFLSFVKSKGIKYFEFSHLFTQWGAKYCPKIVISKNGKKEKRFGWKVNSDSNEYYTFLASFLVALDKFLVKNNYNSISYFHISDEPNLESIDKYKKHRDFLKKYLSNYQFMDALSDYSFLPYVDLPVVSDDHIQKFIDNKAKTMVYYCCAQAFDYVPNVFINMPSIRNRIIGFMMYLNDTLGFLQWGYNFYHSAFSREKINPYICNDANETFNPGDAFIVYPGVNYEPVNSIRNVVFHEAIQDYRLCQLVASKVGEKKVKDLITKAGIKGYTTYSHHNNDLLKLRNVLMNYLK